jgi:hypothetical protein
LAYHSTELFAHEPLQFRLSTAQGEVNAAHDVAAVPGLHIQRRGDRQNISISQIKKLRGNGGGSQVNGHAKALARRKLEGGLIAQDGHLPLRQLEFEITRDGMPARQTPAPGKLCARQQFFFLLADRQNAFQNFDAAAFATPASTAGKLDSLREKNVLQLGAGSGLQLEIGGRKFEGMR